MIKVTGHRLLVKRYKLEERDQVYKSAKAAGLVLADTDDKRRAEAGVDRGEVIQVGPDCWKAFYLNANPHDPSLEGFQPWCKEGDVIIFAKYSGKDYRDDKEIDYLILNDEDVVAILGEENV